MLFRSRVHHPQCVGLAETGVGELAYRHIGIATGSLEIESRDLEAEVAARDAREQDFRQDAHSLLRLALLGPRLVRRRGRDPLGGLVGASACRLALLDVLVLPFALRALHTAWWH